MYKVQNYKYFLTNQETNELSEEIAEFKKTIPAEIIKEIEAIIAGIKKNQSEFQERLKRISYPQNLLAFYILSKETNHRYSDIIDVIEGQRLNITISQLLLRLPDCYPIMQQMIAYEYLKYSFGERNILDADFFDIHFKRVFSDEMLMDIFNSWDKTYEKRGPSLKKHYIQQFLDFIYKTHRNPCFEIEKFLKNLVPELNNLLCTIMLDRDLYEDTYNKDMRHLEKLIPYFIKLGMFSKAFMKKEFEGNLQNSPEKILLFSRYYVEKMSSTFNPFYEEDKALEEFQFIKLLGRHIPKKYLTQAVLLLLSEKACDGKTAKEIAAMASALEKEISTRDESVQTALNYYLWSQQGWNAPKLTAGQLKNLTICLNIISTLKFEKDFNINKNVKDFSELPDELCKILFAVFRPYLFCSDEKRFLIKFFSHEKNKHALVDYLLQQKLNLNLKEIACFLNKKSVIYQIVNFDQSEEKVKDPNIILKLHTNSCEKLLKKFELYDRRYFSGNTVTYDFKESNYYNHSGYEFYLFIAAGFKVNFISDSIKILFNNALNITNYDAPHMLNLFLENPHCYKYFLENHFDNIEKFFIDEKNKSNEIRKKLIFIKYNILNCCFYNEDLDNFFKVLQMLVKNGIILTPYIDLYERDKKNIILPTFIEALKKQINEKIPKEKIHEIIGFIEENFDIDLKRTPFHRIKKNMPQDIKKFDFRNREFVREIKELLDKHRAFFTIEVFTNEILPYYQVYSQLNRYLKYYFILHIINDSNEDMLLVYIFNLKAYELKELINEAINDNLSKEKFGKLMQFIINSNVGSQLTNIFDNEKIAKAVLLKVLDMKAIDLFFSILDIVVPISQGEYFQKIFGKYLRWFLNSDWTNRAFLTLLTKINNFLRYGNFHDQEKLKNEINWLVRFLFSVDYFDSKKPFLDNFIFFFVRLDQDSLEHYKDCIKMLFNSELIFLDKDINNFFKIYFNGKIDIILHVKKYILDQINEFKNKIKKTMESPIDDEVLLETYQLLQENFDLYVYYLVPYNCDLKALFQARFALEFNPRFSFSIAHKLLGKLKARCINFYYFIRFILLKELTQEIVKVTDFSGFRADELQAIFDYHFSIMYSVKLKEAFNLMIEKILLANTNFLNKENYKFSEDLTLYLNEKFLLYAVECCNYKLIKCLVENPQFIIINDKFMEQHHLKFQQDEFIDYLLMQLSTSYLGDESAQLSDRGKDNLLELVKYIDKNVFTRRIEKNIKNKNMAAELGKNLYEELFETKTSYLYLLFSRQRYAPNLPLVKNFFEPKDNKGQLKELSQILAPYKNYLLTLDPLNQPKATLTKKNDDIKIPTENYIFNSYNASL